jgi:hypothetical protein
MGNTRGKPNYMRFRRPRTRAIKGLNNIYVINTLARSALASAKEQISLQRGKLGFEVPSVSGERIVAARNRGKIIRLLRQAIDRDLRTQALVACVALTENYLADMLREVFRGYPNKLSGESKTVDLALVLAADNLDDLICAVIERQIHSVFYERPDRYFAFIEDVLSVSIPDALKAGYSEVKATRDILVHNDGVANAIYIRKSGGGARVGEGQPLPVDEAYFDSSVRSMKKLIQSVYSQLLDKFGDADVWHPKASSRLRGRQGRK